MQVNQFTHCYWTQAMKGQTLMWRLNRHPRSTGRALTFIPNRIYIRKQCLAPRSVRSKSNHSRDSKWLLGTGSSKQSPEREYSTDFPEAIFVCFIWDKPFPLSQFGHFINRGQFSTDVPDQSFSSFHIIHYRISLHLIIPSSSFRVPKSGSLSFFWSHISFCNSHPQQTLSKVHEP